MISPFWSILLYFIELGRFCWKKFMCQDRLLPYEYFTRKKILLACMQRQKFDCFSPAKRYGLPCTMNERYWTRKSSLLGQSRPHKEPFLQLECIKVNSCVKRIICYPVFCPMLKSNLISGNYSERAFWLFQRQPRPAACIGFECRALGAHGPAPEDFKARRGLYQWRTLRPHQTQPQKRCSRWLKLPRSSKTDL